MNHYGHILAVVGADTLIHCADRYMHALALITVHFSRTKNRIHQHFIPAQLQGIDTITLFLGEIYSFPFLSLVVHEHGIQLNLYQQGYGDLKPPVATLSDHLQSANKTPESPPVDELLVMRFHPIDFTFACRFPYFMLVYRVLHFLGIAFWQRLVFNNTLISESY